jgi:hypothetical protein
MVRGLPRPNVKVLWEWLREAKLAAVTRLASALPAAAMLGEPIGACPNHDVRLPTATSIVSPAPEKSPLRLHTRARVVPAASPFPERHGVLA